MAEAPGPGKIDSIAFDVELPVSDGVIRGRVAVSAGPLGLAALVATAQQLTDAVVDHAVRLEVLNNRQVSCQRGCAACCRLMVPVSPPEALRLMDLIERFEPSRRDRVLERFEQAERTLERRGLVAELLDPQWSDDAVLPVAREYFALQLACPFLEDELCGIHPQRPAACRDYNVTSPAEWCKQPHDHEIAKVPTPIPLCVPLSRTAARLTGDRPQLIPLTLAVRWVRNHADLRRRTWPGVELFERFLAEMHAVYT